MSSDWQIERYEPSHGWRVKINGVYVADGATGEPEIFRPAYTMCSFEEFEIWQRQLMSSRDWRVIKPAST